MTEKGALQEANYLIRHGLVWVLHATRAGEPSEIASIVAVTRQSEGVAGISKVFTNPRWRKKGCAERLVRHVCKLLLQHRHSVVLYVAHDNPAAAGVYRRVGFTGLEGGQTGVNAWLEIGFDRSIAHLGHW